MHQSAASRPYFQQDFSAAEFTARRAKVLEAVGPGAVAVLQGAASSGAFDIFRQTNDFYYLCGVEVPHAYLTIDGRDGRSVLYLPRRDAKHERSDGPQLAAEDVELLRELTGVDDVRSLESLGETLLKASIVYTPHSGAEGRQQCRDTLRHGRSCVEADPWISHSSREADFGERLRAMTPGVDLRDLSPTLDRLRIIKSPRELDMMRRAGQLTALAVAEAIRSTRPGLDEYHLAALAEVIYLAGGARGGGYRPIIACGKNIWNAHYYRNNSKLVSGELVLMDYAPDYGYYTSDIGRIWPVDGKYTREQRELYGYIVEYHKALFARIRPGRTIEEIHADAAEHMRGVIEHWEWSRPSFKRAAEETLNFKGHLSHGVGMAVHDVGNYRTEPLTPGVVFALDPQMWVTDEQIYIRVEDTVAVTETGVENLTPGAPLELDDVEAMMREPGLYDGNAELWRQVIL